MEGKKILYITSEMIPYFPDNPMSILANTLPKKMYDAGADVRVFMPRFGVINERRHQLHEVIRLSGMNIIINDIDQPLIIKVASIPGTRLQVYFIDNDEYFKRKSVDRDDEGKLFEDNDERAIFFAKGVLETVKKLNWRPDVIHVMGWMSALVPIYLRQYYADDSFFENTKTVVSVFDNIEKETINKDLINKLAFDGINGESTELLKDPMIENVIKSAIKFSDGVVKGDEVLPEEIANFVDKENIAVLDYENHLNADNAYKQFYTEELLETN